MSFKAHSPSILKIITFFGIRRTAQTRTNPREPGNLKITSEILVIHEEKKTSVITNVKSHFIPSLK